MLEHWVTIKGTAVLAGITTGGVFMGEIASQISGNTNISISEAVAVCSVVLGGAWWLSSKLQKIDDRLESIEAIQAKMTKKCETMACQPKENI